MNKQTLAILSGCLFVVCLTASLVLMRNDFNRDWKTSHAAINQWKEMRVLFFGIRWVESRGGLSPTGDDGKSKGPYHITRNYWQDSCEHLRIDWDYDTHVWNRDRCEYIMVGYWDRYGAKTPEQKARMHNGGPRGHLKKSTLTYWYKVKWIMKQYKEN